jgi:hypothetical protein
VERTFAWPRDFERLLVSYKRGRRAARLSRHRMLSDLLQMPAGSEFESLLGRVS